MELKLTHDYSPLIETIYRALQDVQGRFRGRGVSLYWRDFKTPVSDSLRELTDQRALEINFTLALRKRGLETWRIDVDSEWGRDLEIVLPSTLEDHKQELFRFYSLESLLQDNEGEIRDYIQFPGR